MDIRKYFTSLTPRQSAVSDESKSNTEMSKEVKSKKRKEPEVSADSEEPIPKKRGRKKKVLVDEEEPIPKTDVDVPNKRLKKNQSSPLKKVVVDEEEPIPKTDVDVSSKKLKKNQALNKDESKPSVSSKRKVAELSDPPIVDINVTKSPLKKKEVTHTPKKMEVEIEVADLTQSPVTRSKSAAASSPLKNNSKSEMKKTPPKIDKDTPSKATVNKGKIESPMKNSDERRKSPRKMLFDNSKNVTSIKPIVNAVNEKNGQKSTEAEAVAQMFVDKYKPTTSKQLIGQQGDRSNAKKLANWLMNWHSNIDKKPAYNRGGVSDDSSGFRAALLSGPPGVGKTTTATIICKELGFDVSELNASDARNKKSLEEHVATLLHNKVLSNFMKLPNGNKSDGTKHVLIMDEVDGMAGNEDRGGVQELIQLIKKTQVPVICICNDRSHPKIRSLVNYCYDLRFYKPTVEQIKAAMMSVCFKEKIKVSNDVLHELILSTNRDIRQVLHSISLLSSKDHDLNKMMSNCSLKDVKLGPFDAIKKVFTAGPEYNQMSFKDKSDLFFMDYSLMSLFCFENYIKARPSAAKNNEAEKLKLAAKSIDAMAFGDLIEREIRTTNNWSLLPVQAVFSTVMPSVYMNGTMPHLSSFPALLGKISSTNKKDRLLQELSTHMSLTISGDKSSLNLDYLEPLRLAITHPLITKGNEGVADVLEVLHAYNLLKEDIDTIIELSLWSDQKNPMTNIDSKTKAALTRAYNKDGELLPYDSQGIKKGKKVSPTVIDDLEMNGEEDEAEESEKEDDFALRAKKKPGKKVTKDTSESSSPKTQKPKATAAKRGRKKKS